MNTQTAIGPSQIFTATSLAVAGACVALLVTMTDGSLHHPDDNTISYRDLQCKNLARTYAGRSHSMLDTGSMREATDQAVQICQKDPAAFRNQLR